jgi:hypothetical protein
MNFDKERKEIQVTDKNFLISFNINNHKSEESPDEQTNYDGDIGCEFGVSIKQRNHANARERFRTHRFYF